jgi:hypothetical protein
LLEILIVGVLTSVLMLGVWSLFRTWGQLYERGERRVQTAQLVRSLCDQFTDDVRSVSYVPPPLRQRRSAGERGSGSRQRQRSRGSLALAGGANWLVLDVLQPPNPFVGRTAAAGELDLPDASQTLCAAELQRVMYSFQPPASDGLESLSSTVLEMAELDDTELLASDDEELAEPLTGLLRITVPVEQFDQVTAATSQESGLRRSSSVSDAVWQLRELLGGSSDAGSAAMTSAQFEATTNVTGGDAAGINVAGLDRDEVPEVIWLEFRYFDGSRWLSSWDSQSEGRLPVAVEMRFELQEAEPADENRAGDGDTELVDDGLTEAELMEDTLSAESALSVAGEEGLVLGSESSEPTPYHRCVVHLNSPE